MLYAGTKHGWRGVDGSGGEGGKGKRSGWTCSKGNERADDATKPGPGNGADPNTRARKGTEWAGRTTRSSHTGNPVSFFAFTTPCPGTILCREDQTLYHSVVKIVTNV